MESNQKDLKSHVKKFLNGDESFMVGNYCAKKKKIGMGSFATIYHAIELDRDREVAIKTIRVPDIRRLADNITREIKIMKELKHPNIIRLYDIIYDRDFDNVHLILEYAPNGNLSDYLKKKGPISEAYAKVYMKQLSSGLHYLLSRSEPIVHRDLKPQNILMFGDYGIKLTDFGFARNFQVDDLFNTLCGTPLYMAPELLLPSKDKSDKKYTTKVDLWSIGIILYEMLTGKIPSYSKSVAQLSTKLRDHDFKLPYSIKVSPECRDLLEKLLVKDPINRIEWDDFFSHVWFASDEIMDKDNHVIQMADDMMTSSSFNMSSHELLKKFSSTINSTTDNRLPSSKPNKELSNLHDSLQELRKSFYSKKNISDKKISKTPKPNLKLTVSPDTENLNLSEIKYADIKDALQTFPDDYESDQDNEMFFSCELDIQDDHSFNLENEQKSSTTSPTSSSASSSSASYTYESPEPELATPELPKTNIPIEQSKICNLLETELSTKLDEVMTQLNEIWKKKKALQKHDLNTKNDSTSSKSYDPELSFNKMMGHDSMNNPDPEDVDDEFQMVNLSFKDDYFNSSKKKERNNVNDSSIILEENEKGKYVVISTNPINIRANSDITCNRATYQNGFKYYLDNSINFLKDSYTYFANNRKSL
jgi:serine/threonine protein kinase